MKNPIIFYLILLHFFAAEANEGRLADNTLPVRDGSGISSGNIVSEIHKKQDIIISSLRPRIFVRADEAETGRGITLSELRARVGDPAYKDWISYIQEEKRYGNMPALAMQYLLTGDREYAVMVGDFLSREPFNFGEHTSAAAAVYHSAIAFDWVRDALPDETAGIISDKLVAGAEHLKSGVTSPAINHNYTIVSLYGMAMSAIAIFGENEEMSRKSLEYMNMIRDLLEDEHMLLETFRNKEGVWGEGNHYTPYVVYYPFLMTLRGLTSATGTDYFRLIRDDHENFIVPMAKFVIANFRPDFTLERIGDVLGTVVPVRTFMQPLLELMASEIDDKVLQGQVRYFSAAMGNFYDQPLVHNAFKWLMMVNYDTGLPAEPSYKSLPLVMRLGKDAYEHIMFRNSWEEGGTLITYISGDQYTHHQHLDKGHFLIYSNGGLAVDGGGYGIPMYGDNWANYSTRSIAHNSVLVYDPDEEPYSGTMGTTIYPDGGQVIQTGNQGHRNWQHWLEIRNSAGLNTARVLAFDYDQGGNEYNYVKSDLTTAYGKRTLLTDRQLMYLPAVDYLVVKDRVITSRPMEKFWLLHFEEIPVIDGGIPDTGITEFRETAVVRSERTGSMEIGGRNMDYSGALFIKALLPEKSNLTIVGGQGFEYYNRFANKNFPSQRPFEPVIEPGNWRMETGTAEPETRTVFLHAMEIADAGKQDMVPAEYLETDDKGMIGVHFRPHDMNYVVLFSSSTDERGHSFHLTGGPVSYQLDVAEPVIHVLAEMDPDRRVRVIINGNDEGCYTVSEAGILHFRDEGTGVRKIQIKLD